MYILLCLLLVLLPSSVVAFYRPEGFQCRETLEDMSVSGSTPACACTHASTCKYVVIWPPTVRTAYALRVVHVYLRMHIHKCYVEVCQLTHIHTLYSLQETVTSSAIPPVQAKGKATTLVTSQTTLQSPSQVCQWVCQWVG